MNCSGVQLLLAEYVTPAIPDPAGDWQAIEARAGGVSEVCHPARQNAASRPAGAEHVGSLGRACPQGGVAGAGLASIPGARGGARGTYGRPMRSCARWCSGPRPGPLDNEREMSGGVMKGGVRFEKSHER